MDNVHWTSLPETFDHCHNGKGRFRYRLPFPCFLPTLLSLFNLGKALLPLSNDFQQKEDDYKEKKDKMWIYDSVRVHVTSSKPKLLLGCYFEAARAVAT